MERSGVEFQLQSIDIITVVADFLQLSCKREPDWIRSAIYKSVPGPCGKHVYLQDFGELISRLSHHVINGGRMNPFVHFLSLSCFYLFMST